MTREAKDGTVRISNAVEDGTLLQVFVSHESGVLLGPASPDELAPPKTTRSKSLTTEGIPSEIFNSESHQKVSDKGHVLEQKFFMNRIVIQAFEMDHTFFVSDGTATFLMTTRGNLRSTYHETTSSRLFDNGT